MPEILRVEHLRKYYKNNSFYAVDDISFNVQRGEVFSLVGESGCGKTTTGRSIIGLNKITGGKIYFKDKLVNAGSYGISDKREARKILDEAKNANKEWKNQYGELLTTKVQMIFQDPSTSLNPRMTVREIVSEGLRVKGEKNEKIISEKVSEALLGVGLLPEYMDRYPHEFSGGQKQRIGIARALIMNPEVIIADEPVSALDVSIKAQIINLLNELRKKYSLTIVFIAHDLSVIKYFSDRIAVMYYGKIVELAASEELFKNPLHPYTKSLLSAIPLPDPEYEKSRTRIIYNPKECHDYTVDKPEMKEIVSGHFVFCNNREELLYKNMLS